ncbi:MAG: hypothetical protein R2849_22700 [Thermomicrobiales bacterium]
MERVETVEVLFEDLAHRAKLALASALRHIEENPLGVVERVLDLGAVIETDPDDLAAGVNEPAANGGPGDDAGVVLGVDGRRRRGNEFREVRLAADVLDEALPAELVDERDEVCRFPAIVKR